MFFALSFELFAFGRRQAEEEVVPINPTWTLVITAFDVSAMSPAWQTAGDTMTRSLVTALQNVNFRIRSEEESAFLLDFAQTRSRTAVTGRLVEKRNERDLLIFRGLPYWQFERDLRNVEREIRRIEEELAELETAFPHVEEKPEFRLVQTNINGVFPPPPEPGRENRFLTEHNADAFLVGNLSEFHGRIFLEMSMYTRHTASFSFEDWVLFSPEDFDTVLGEIGNRVAIEVSGSYPSTILVRATPPDAMVLIDGMFAGRGEFEHIRFPGEAEISVQADNYIPLAFPLELDPGELAEIFINLTPLGRNIFEVETPDRLASRVYRGGLFVGETPLALELPRHEFSYITVETEDGEMGSIIYRDNVIVRGDTQIVRMNGNRARADFITAPPLTEEERQVSRARNFFYRAYGALWIALPVGLLTAGVAGNHLNSNDPAAISRANALTMGAYGVIGAALGATFFYIWRYIRASGRDATPMARVVTPEPEPEPEPEDADADEEAEADIDADAETESEIDA